jgi:hypothetical protein
MAARDRICCIECPLSAFHVRKPASPLSARIDYNRPDGCALHLGHLGRISRYLEPAVRNEMSCGSAMLPCNDVIRQIEGGVEIIVIDPVA